MPSFVSRFLRRKQYPTAEDKFEYSQLYPPSQQSDWGTANRETAVDIVAIHGLGGDRFNTWRKGDKLWLRDLLPGHLSAFDLRNSTFGYNSTIFGRSPSQIRNCAERLLIELVSRRRATNTAGIPIVFVCHSLGGIICKMAFNISYQQNVIYRDIKDSTKGIIFMGTPHLDADIEGWGQFLAKIGNLVSTRSLRTDLLKDLKSKSKQFGDIAALFRETATGLKIVSMFECRPTKGVMIVNDASLTLRIQNERTVAVECSHLEICRFSGSEFYYPTVSGAVLEVIKQICPVSNSDNYENLREEYLKHLFFPGFNARIYTIKAKQQDTFEWIWYHAKFQEWEQRKGSTLLWLHGKPATGKSTLMKSVRLGLEQRSREGSFVVNFFYDCRGGEAQRGHEFMLRSILYQLLRVIPSSGVRLRDVYSACHPSNLDLDALILVFTKLIKHINFRTVLYVIIDAIDESDITRRLDILKMLTDSCGSDSSSEQNLILKILVASRPAVDIQNAFSNCLTLKLENETLPDIRHYVQFETNRICTVMGVSMDLLEKVIEGLIERSSGVFLWVKLVTLELQEKASTGCTVGEIEKRLWSLPSELEDMYARVLAKLVEQHTVAARLFHWVAYSKRPLTLTEIKEVMAVDSLGESFNNADLRKSRAISQGHVERRLTTLCGGLVEVENNTVQFIHQTALDYLFRLPMSSQFFISQVSGDEYITSTCNCYLRFIDDTIGACKVPEDPDVWKQGHLYRVIDFFEDLHLFSYAIFHFSQRKASGGDNAQVFQMLSRAFRTAKRERNSKAIARLLRIVVGKRDTEPPILDVNVDCGPRTDLLEVEDENHFNPIHIAAKLGYRDVVALLIDWGAMKLSTTNKCGITPLHLASENGNEATVQLLLEKGARIDAQAKDTFASTPLDLAVKNGQEGMVRLLRDFQTRSRTSSW